MHALQSKKTRPLTSASAEKYTSDYGVFSLHTLSFCNAVAVYMPPRAMYASPMAFNKVFGWSTVERLSRDWVLGSLVWRPREIEGCCRWSEW